MKFPEEYCDEFLCEDCFKFLPKLPDECVDLVLTDPPYGIDYQSNRRVAREKLPKFEGDVDLSWLPRFVEEIDRVLKPNRHFYCFTRFDTYPVFYKAISERFKIKNCLIWVKNNHGSGDLKGAYAPQSEMIIFAAKGRRELFGPRESDVLQYNNVPSALRAHATQKPVDLLRLLIEKSTLPEEVVLDPFGGTGSTGLACKDTLRHKGDKKERFYVLIELNRDFHRTGLRGGLGKQGRLWQNLPRTEKPVPARKRPVVRSRRMPRARANETLPLDLKIPT